jgi:hypothetical protein
MSTVEGRERRRKNIDGRYPCLELLSELLTVSEYSRHAGPDPASRKGLDSDVRRNDSDKTIIKQLIRAVGDSRIVGCMEGQHEHVFGSGEDLSTDTGTSYKC